MAEAEHSSFCQLALDLERLTVHECLTEGRVAEFYFGNSVAKRYVDLIFEQASFEQQWLTLSNWNEPAKRKVELVSEHLADIFEAATGGVSSSSILTRLAKFENRRLFASYVESAARLLPEQARFGREILQIWLPGPNETRASLMVRASKFDEVVCLFKARPATSSQPVESWRQSSRRTAKLEASRSDSPKHRKRISKSIEGQFLKVAEVRKLWEAASFMVQNYGTLLNSWIVIRHKDLELNSDTKPAALITDLFRELRIRLDESDTSVHWLYVHRFSEEEGLVTDIVAHLPSDRADIESWLRERFLVRRIIGALPSSAVTVRHLQRSDRVERDRFKRHLTLLRGLCASLDAHSRDALQLMKRLRNKKWNHSVGAKMTSQRIGVSRGIDTAAREKADRDLPVLSAFDSNQFSAFYNGWELKEYEYREALRSERAALANEIRRDYQNTPQLDIRLARFERAWADDQGARSMHRPEFS